MYEYKCAKCKKSFDALQKFSDPPLKKHEGCGGKLEKLMSAPAFQFKGTGWYVTDYGKGGVKPSSTAEAKADAKAESAATASSSSDTKPETKTESKAETAAATPAAASASTAETKTKAKSSSKKKN
jgi:putative FmdB family regulatory protein